MSKLSPEAERKIREQKRRQELGEDAHCIRCNSHEIVVLHTTILCYDCWLYIAKKSVTEDHHILGQAQSPDTVNVPGNLHRYLSDRQQDWDEDSRRGDPADPLLIIIRALQAIKGFAEWLVDHLGDFILFLRKLRDWFVKRYGKEWVKASQMDPLYT